MKNLLVSFSGGETSAYMAQWLWNNKQDDYNMCFVFANTGQENEETLEFVLQCSKHFGFHVYWVEAKVIHEKRKGTIYKEVDYETATRLYDYKINTNTPFEQIIKKYGVPNMAFPHCTRELKQVPIKKFADNYFKGEKYEMAIGIRYDELSRQNDKADKFKIIYPLIDMKITKPMINMYWENMPFRLDLKDYQGNCRWCWKKGFEKLAKIYNEDNNSFEFAKQMEHKYGNPYGKIPKTTYSIAEDESGNDYIKAETEKIPKEELKIVFFRENKSAQDIIDMAKTGIHPTNQQELWNESCEVFTDCGNV